MANRVGRRCDRDKEAFWRAAVGRCESGGLSVRAFCRREGIAEPSFYHWRRELVRREAARTEPEPSDKVEPSLQVEPLRGTEPRHKVVPGATPAPAVATSAPVAGRASIAIPRAGSADEEAGPLFVPVRIPGADSRSRGRGSPELPDPHPNKRQSSDERQSVAHQRRTEADDRSRGDSVVEVVLRGGRVLRFVGGIDRRTLADLVAALEDDAC